MFQFRRFPTYTYLIQCTLHGYCPCGLPHSEISGSMDICSSPKLIAACHVLRRLLMPRHSPCALYSLTNQKQTSACSRCELCRQSQRNCNRYPNIFSDAIPQLKFTLSIPLSMETSLLPYFTYESHCSVFKVQLVVASFISLVSACWPKLIHFAAPPLRQKQVFGGRDGRRRFLTLLKPDLKVQFLGL